MGRGVCGVCDVSSGRCFCCANCVNNNLSERRVLLQSLLQQREELEGQLSNLLTQKQARSTQEIERSRRQDAADNEALHALQAKKELQRAKESVEAVRRENAARKAAAEQASTQLAATRADVLDSQLPTLLRYQGLTQSHVGAMLLREQRLKLKQLLDILPLRITALRSGGLGPSSLGPGGAAGPAGGTGSAIQMSICDLKVPDSVAVPLNGWQQPEAVSAALGYMMLFLDLLTTYMGGPLLHEGSFQGSTTVLWTQQSFWNRKPGSSNGVLPLYLEDLATTSGTFSSKSKGSTWAALPLMRVSASAPRGPPSSDKLQAQTQGSGSGSIAEASALNTVAPSGNSGDWGGVPSSPPVTGGGLKIATRGGSFSSGPSGSQGASARQGSGTSSSGGRGGELRQAFDMLQKSTSCFVRDKALAYGLTLPEAWGPVGWLVLLCSFLRKDARTDGVMAAANMLNEAPSARIIDASSLGTEEGARHAEQRHAISYSGSYNDFASPPSTTGMGARQPHLQQHHTYHHSASTGNMSASGSGYGPPGAGGPEAEDAEGWDVVKPVLPPPPSEPEEVEHYSRAMFTDANSRSGSGGALGKGAGAAQVGFGAAQAASGAVERPARRTPAGALRALFGAGRGSSSGSGGVG